MTLAALIILLAFAAYSLFSKSIARSVVTLPILFTALGFLLSDRLNAALPAALIYARKYLPK
jgi:sodium/hydrogen antiporter